jgi:hypothetical protein
VRQEFGNLITRRRKGRSMSDYVVKPLTPATWDAFARLAERHNGVFGGCWCTWFQTLPAEKTYDADDNRALKKRLVDEGRAHAALVFEGDEAVAWCEYGTPEELPNIYHRKQYEAELDRSPGQKVSVLYNGSRDGATRAQPASVKSASMVKAAG